MGVVREMSYGPWIKSLVTTSCKLLVACFCSLSFAREAFCAHKLNSNYTTGWQSTEFVHLREAWRFSTAVNTYAWVWTVVCKSSFLNEEIDALLIKALCFTIHTKSLLEKEKKIKFLSDEEKIHSLYLTVVTHWYWFNRSIKISKYLQGNYALLDAMP